MNNIKNILLLSSTFFLVNACASITVRKVPSHENAFLQTSEEKKAAFQEAEKMEGVRYYLPRPYIAVKQPFPVGGQDFYITGRVEKGELLSLDPTQLPEEIKSYFILSGASALIPLSSVRVSGVKQQANTSAAEKPAENKTAETSENKKEEQVPSNQENSKEKDSQKASIKSNIITGGDPQSSPLLEVSNYLNVVYLPDFTEQYAIQVNSGLGAVSLDVGLENGWMLERTNLTIDNSALGAFLFKNTEKFIDIGVDIAKAATSKWFPTNEKADPSDSSPPDSSGTPKTQSAVVGQEVILRIRYVLEAQPGLYPILKPWEKVSATPSDTGDNTYVHLPYRPYTVAAFNVKKIIAIEIVNLSTSVVSNKGLGNPEENYNRFPPKEEGKQWSEVEMISELSSLIPSIDDSLEKGVKIQNLDPKQSSLEGYKTLIVIITSDAQPENKQKVEEALFKVFKAGYPGTQFTVKHK